MICIQCGMKALAGSDCCFYYPKCLPKKEGFLRCVNRKTEEWRYYKPVGLNTLRKALDNAIDRCVGPCKCKIECDGICPNGWQSRMLRQRMI